MLFDPTMHSRFDLLVGRCPVDYKSDPLTRVAFRRDNASIWALLERGWDEPNHSELYPFPLLNQRWGKDVFLNRIARGSLCRRVAHWNPAALQNPLLRLR